MAGPPPADLDRLREWQRHEDLLFANRLSYLVLTESILVLAESAMLSSGHISRIVIFVAYEFIAVVGLVLTLSFWYVFRDNAGLIYLIRQQVEQHELPDALHKTIDRLHQEARKKSVFYGIALHQAPNRVAANLISAIFLLLWIVLAVVGTLAG